jgi:hypothetical protein
VAEDHVEVGFGDEEQMLGGHAQPVGAHLELLDGLFARDVQHGATGRGEAGRQLHQQRGFADARVAADERERAGHDAPAHHALEFLHLYAQARHVA